VHFLAAGNSEDKIVNANYVVFQLTKRTTTTVDTGKIFLLTQLTSVYFVRQRVLNLNNIFFFFFFFCSGSAYKNQPNFGRHGAHKHHDSMGEVSKIPFNVPSNYIVFGDFVSKNSSNFSFEPTRLISTQSNFSNCYILNSTNLDVCLRNSF